MICPRKDVDVIPVNDCVKQMSELHGVNYMNIYGAFTFNDGSVATHFYYRDGVHLNNAGTSTLVRSINNVVPIIKINTNQQQNINQTRNSQRHQYMKNQHQYTKIQNRTWRSPYDRIGSDYSTRGYSMERVSQWYQGQRNSHDQNSHHIRKSNTKRSALSFNQWKTRKKTDAVPSILGQAKQ